LVGVLFSLALSWGKNFSILTDFFIDYIPFYNKFRAVSSIQVILELCFPILAALGLQWALTTKNKFDFPKFAKRVGIPILFLIGLLLFKGSLSFSGLNDSYFTEIYGAELVNVIKEARVSIFQEDLIRAILILLFLSTLVAYYQFKHANKNLILVMCIGILLFDLLGVSSRYISRDNFVSPSRAAVPFQITGADRTIQQDSSRYRVFEPQLGLTGARTAYFHNSLGGYHGAKPRRFEELINYYNTHQIPAVLDFLNVKYVLVNDTEENSLQPLNNPNALGTAWAVEKIKVVPTADALLESMKTTDFSSQALVLENSFPEDIPLKYQQDSLTTVNLVEEAADHLVYHVQADLDQFIVFSEMYYHQGWRATVNGLQTPIINVNYVLRGLKVPAGNSTVEFRFEPEVVVLGTAIRWGSLILFVLLLGAFYFVQSRSKNQLA